MAAFFAVMLFPFRAHDADAVIAAVIGGLFLTAILTQFTVGANIYAVFTFSAFHTESDTVGAVITAVLADGIGTVAAVMAVIAKCIRTVTANSAVGTVFIHAARAFSAFLAHIFRAVTADDSAFLADLGAVAALAAFLAEQIPCTFAAQVTGGAEFVAAVGADLTAVGTKVRAVFASFTAGTDDAALGAKSADHAKAVRACTVNALAALRAKLAVGAIGAFFTAFHADRGTIGASAAAGADHFHTGDTQ